MGVGDEIMAMGDAEALHASCGDQVVILGINRQPRWHHVWDNNPAISKQGKIRMVNGPGFRRYIIARGRGKRTIFDPAHKAKAGKICLTASERQRVEMLCPSGDFVIIEPMTHFPGSSRNKNWGMENWEQVIKDFPLPVYQFDIGDDAPRLNGALPIFSTDIRVSAGIVARAKLVLTIDGGMHHIAASMKRPAVVVFGGFCDPKITGYDFHHNFYADIPGSPCGRYDDCPHCRTAMSMITPDAVRAAAIEILRKRGALV